MCDYINDVVHTLKVIVYYLNLKTLFEYIKTKSII